MDERTTRVKEILGLRRVPIKIGFLEAPPPLARWSGGPVAAGCVFWDRAMEGKSFYTLPADHWNCAVGSHTHKIGLPADRGNELDDTIGFMVETRYLDAAEVANIPTLERPPAAVAYAPATSEAFKADVVLLAVTPVAVDAGVRGGPEGGHRARLRGRDQPPELRDPAGVGQDRGRRDLVRLPRQPHVHHGGRRRDVRRDSGPALGRLRRSSDRGAALEPDDGELLPGAGGEVLRAEVVGAAI